MNPLVTLGASELRALAAAASDGRLNPATPGLVGRFVSEGAAVSRALGELAASGASLAATLELLAEAAERRGSVEDLVELVLTGPNMGAGRDTGVVVRQLFREARKCVWVCGYKLYDARDLFVDLARPELRVRMLLARYRGGRGAERRSGSPTLPGRLPAMALARRAGAARDLVRPVIAAAVWGEPGGSSCEMRCCRQSVSFRVFRKLHRGFSEPKS